jgi:cobalt transporter subunit CbtB
MSTSVLSQTRTDAGHALSRLHTAALVTAVVAVSLLTLYAVFVGQSTFLHEFTHDGRHLFGAPCH